MTDTTRPEGHADFTLNIRILTPPIGTIAVISPEGKLIEDIYLPGEKPTNVAFGGEDFKTVFVTLQGKKRIVKFESPNAGAVSRFF